MTHIISIVTVLLDVYVILSAWAVYKVCTKKDAKAIAASSAASMVKLDVSVKIIFIVIAVLEIGWASLVWSQLGTTLATAEAFGYSVGIVFSIAALFSNIKGVLIDAVCTLCSVAGGVLAITHIASLVI